MGGNDESHGQITGACGDWLVLSAVFAPMIFFQGHNIIYRSSPLRHLLDASVGGGRFGPDAVLCASLPSLWRRGMKRRRPIRFCRPSSCLRRLFYRLRDTTCRSAARSRSQIRFVHRLCPIVVLMGYLFVRMPTAYLPDEDQGVLGVVQLPPGSTREQTEDVMTKLPGTSWKTRRCRRILHDRGRFSRGVADRTG